MLITIIERINNKNVERIEEVDNMKVKCHLCLLKTGVSIKTDNVYLVTIQGRDYLVCSHCKAQITTDRRNENEKQKTDLYSN